MGPQATLDGGLLRGAREGGVGLMVTGGIAPNNAGRVAPMAAMMTTPVMPRGTRRLPTLARRARRL